MLFYHKFCYKLMSDFHCVSYTLNKWSGKQNNKFWSIPQVTCIRTQYLMKCHNRQLQSSFLERHQALGMLAILYIFHLNTISRVFFFHLKQSISLRMQTAVLHSTTSHRIRDFKGQIWGIFCIHMQTSMKIMTKSKNKKK